MKPPARKAVQVWWERYGGYIEAGSFSRVSFRVRPWPVDPAKYPLKELSRGVYSPRPVDFPVSPLRVVMVALLVVGGLAMCAGFWSLVAHALLK